MIKVVIIENDLTCLRYLVALLSGSDGIDVIEVYSTGTEAVKGIPGNVPDVLVINPNLPDISGIHVIGTLSQQFASMEILVLTTYEDRENLLSALKAGASGYLLKDTCPAEIIKAIADLMKGGSPMSLKISRRVIEEFRTMRVREKAHASLTQREIEVLIDIAKGFPEIKIASQLSLSPHTIHSHVKNIYRKLNVKSKTEAILKAKSKGII